MTGINYIEALKFDLVKQTFWNIFYLIFYKILQLSLTFTRRFFLVGYNPTKTMSMGAKDIDYPMANRIPC